VLLEDRFVEDRVSNRLARARSLSRHVSLLVVAALVATGCGRTTTLSGCIQVNTPAGDLKRAAGAVVIAGAIPGAFEKEWHALLTAFRQQYHGARATYEHAQQRHRAARVAERTASNALRQAVKNPALDRYTVQEDGESGVRLWTNQQPPASVWHAAQARSDAWQGVEDAGRRLNGVIDLHLSRAVDTIKKHHTDWVLADARGCYRLAVPVQRVYVLANHGDRYWFRELAVPRGPVKLDLSPADEGWPFSDVTRPG
jgi:hypothetical protein